MPSYRLPAGGYIELRMDTITLARHAMATRFELVLHGDNPTGLRAAGEEALDEVDRLENRLSLYRPASEIAQINARAAREAVQVSPELFALLQQAQKLSQVTGGAFDITIAPLVRCWGFMGGTGKMTTTEEVAAAREVVGMRNVTLDAAARTIRFAREGVMLDLGAIGKGYAVDQAAMILREAGVTSALVHGGTSTTYAIGHPPDSNAWKIAIEQAPTAFNPTDFPSMPPIELRDEALSVSAIWGRAFQAEGKNFGHVIDPRIGEPVSAAFLTAVILPSATETDALSTALMVQGKAGPAMMSKVCPGAKFSIVSQRDGRYHIESNQQQSKSNTR